eukprot:sb/3463252/
MTTISAEFLKSSIGPFYTSSSPVLFKEFLWRFDVSIKSKKHDYLEVYLSCEPMYSTKEWMCSTFYTVTEKSSGKKKGMNITFSNANNYGYGWSKFMLLKDLFGAEKFSLEAAITIKDIYLGQPAVTQTNLRQVVFHRPVKYFLSEFNQKSSYQAGESTWIVYGKEMDGEHGKGLEFQVDEFGADGKVSCDQPSGAVVITLRGSTSTEVKSGKLGEEICFETQTNEHSVVTFSIDCQPFQCDTEVKRGSDFGREYLSQPNHGNLNFSLKDSSKIPLNSYIMAKNSSVLKDIIEKENESEHDVSDFNSKSVRIFVDACYTGTLEMLLSVPEFSVFSDFVKMVGVFKVDWAIELCLGFYQKHLPDPTANFDAYWEYALLALDSAVKYGNRNFLDHLISKIPENITKLQFRFFPLAAGITKRANADLVMVMLVEFELYGDFMKQLLTLLMVGHKIPLISYWLENFNFSLCEQETLVLLAEAIEISISSEVSCKFMESLKKEDSLDKKEELEEEEKESDSSEDENDEEEEVSDVKLLSDDGTLATVARNHWTKIESSTWPCSEKRPFSLARRKLWEKEEISEIIEMKQKLSSVCSSDGV